MSARFGEVITAIVTPFKSDGSLDVDGVRSLSSHLVEHGSDGLVVCGTTGESPTLDHAEHNRVIELAVKAAAGRVPVIAGTGSNALTVWPAATRLAAIGPPMLPSPRNATFMPRPF